MYVPPWLTLQQQDHKTTFNICLGKIIPSSGSIAANLLTIIEANLVALYHPSRPSHHHMEDFYHLKNGNIMIISIMINNFE